MEFEKVLLTSNLNILTISGIPSHEDLFAAWEEIMCEYTEAMGNGEYRVSLRLIEEIATLDLKYQLVHLGVAALRGKYSKLIADGTNRHLRTKYEFNPESPKKYFADLDSADRRAKHFLVAKELKEAQLKVIEEKMKADAGDRTIEKNYFTQMLIILGRYNHYKIGKDIFVSEYCSYVNDYAAYVDSLEKSK